MLRPFKDWEVHKLLAVVVVLVGLVGSALANLPFHATSVLVACLLLILLLVFYPWRFPEWAKGGNGTKEDEFYGVMKWVWVGLVLIALLVGIAWPTTNLVWSKSPELLVGRMYEAHIDLQVSHKMGRDGVWDAKLVQEMPDPALILVALPVLDKDRNPHASQERRCVPAIQALKETFGELSPISRDLRLIVIMFIIFVIVMALIERMHEAALKVKARASVDTDSC